MTSPGLKFLLLTTVISGFLYSCKHQTEVSFNYRINGNLLISAASQETAISKTSSKYTKNGNVTLNYTILEKQTSFGSLVDRDSTFTKKTTNGKDYQSYYSITESKFTPESFRLIKEVGKSRTYAVTGNIESEIMTVRNTSDTSKLTLQGTFSDTIYINNVHKKYADEMTHYVINKELMKYIKSELKKQTKQIAEN